MTILMTGGDRPLGVDYEYPPACVICGTELEWFECWQCLGDGDFDLYEDDPLSYAPGQRECCDECGGSGGWMGCPMQHAGAT